MHLLSTCTIVKHAPQLCLHVFLSHEVDADDDGGDYAWERRAPVLGPNVHFSAKLGFQCQTCFSVPNSDFSAKLFSAPKNTLLISTCTKRAVLI